MQPKIIHGGFDWIPLHERIKFPPRKPDHRQPLFRVVRQPESDGHGDELFLVNHSGEEVDSIRIFKTGFITVDGQLYASADEEGVTYLNIPNGSAVKADHFDNFYDLDFVIGLQVEIISKKLGAIKLQSIGSKGGMKDEVLLWETGEPGRYVSILTPAS